MAKNTEFSAKDIPGHTLKPHLEAELPILIAGLPPPKPKRNLRRIFRSLKCAKLPVLREISLGPEFRWLGIDLLIM